MSALRERRAQLDSERPSWKPSRRRAANQTLSSLDRAIAANEQQVAALEAKQALHEAFAIAHEEALADRELLGHAAVARRLKVRVEAVADPPSALTGLLGQRPMGQRQRLRWDRAIESIAVHLDERERPMPDTAATLTDILGPRPAEVLARFDHDRVTNAALSVFDQERELGRSLGRA